MAGDNHPRRSASGFQGLADAVLHAKPQDIHAFPAVDLQNLVHELDSHRVELELQNEELRRIQIQLREAQQRYVDFYVYAPVGYLTLDPAGIIRKANLAAAQLIGLPRSKVAGRKLARFVAAEHQAMLDCHLCNAANTTIPQRCQFQINRPSAESLPVEFTSSAIRDADGLLRCVCVLMADVTVHMKAMQELKEARLTAERANQAKSQFLTNVSHEVRTPMTAILGFAEILSEKTLDSESADAVVTIQRNCHQLLGLMNDLLDLSKIEAGKMTLEQIPCSPAQIVADVISVSRVRAERKGLRLTTEYPTPVPMEIISDPTRLRQILLNLLNNAIKFTKQGAVRLAVRHDESAASLRFEVIDSGIGIDPQSMRCLFQPFTQADSSTTRKYGGTGLGLSISRQIAQLLGGEISVESKEGSGSTFRLIVPVESAAKIRIRPGTSGPPHLKPASSVTVQKESLARMRVLLAEDGVDNQRLISHILRAAGATVAIAGDGRVAVEEALAEWNNNRPFHVILMDMQMPVMDGYEATAMLRDGAYRQPIIALTAHAMAGDRDKCLKAGCDEYLSKPIKRQDLLAALQRFYKPLSQFQPASDPATAELGPAINAP